MNTDATSYTLRVYRAPSQQWSWEVCTEHGPAAAGAGYPDAAEAADAGIAELVEHIPDPADDPSLYTVAEHDYVLATTGGTV